MAKPKKPRIPASATPHDCVILAVDTASNSGWSVWVRGVYYASGETRVMNHGRLVAVVKVAIGAAMDARLTNKQVVLVLERPYAGNAWTQQSLGAARQAWLSAWCEYHGTKTPHRVVRVYPSTWRARLFGTTKGTLDMERAFAAETIAASPWTILLPRAPVSGDEAAAVCIGRWSTLAGEVAAVLPKTRKKKAA